MPKKLEIKAGDKYHRLTVIKELPQRNKKRYFRCECDCGNIIELRIDSLTGGNTKSCGCYHKDKTNISIKNGDIYDRLIIIEEISKRGNQRYFKCICDCGNIVEIGLSNLRKKSISSCGCYTKERHQIHVKSGDRYNELTIIKEVSEKYNRRYFECKCSCGNITEVRLANLRNGSIKSCGCLHKKSITTHGLSRSKYRKIYKTFLGINQRCTNPNERQFKNYGGRGIKNEFENVEQFVEWSLDNGYNIGLSIDRIDNNGNYSPSNCRWVDMKVQGNNKRTNHIIVFENKKYTISQFTKIVFPYYRTSKTHPYEYDTIYRLINRNLSPKEIYNKLKK